MNITNSNIADIDEIFSLYDIATNYQKDKFSGNVWPQFERSLIETEIKEQRQFKLLINDSIACVWAITFSDPQIWEEKDADPAIYIHRIATNPDFRGQQFVIKIVAWAKAYARSQQKQFIRLDTCGHNEGLIAHYQKCGFTFLGISKIKSAEGLPSHYDNADVCYFEIKLN
jgi:ribosomal protein S18 acetylase RimI-like enzyme